MLAKEKNNSKKFLITVTNNHIKELKVNNVNFLFPIKELSVGFLNTYSLSEIDVDNSFIYINRILDKEAIKKLENVLKNLSQNIKGICFTDFGIINLVKKLKIDLELIYMQNHNTTNYRSINYYLEDVDSVLISTDITLEEIKVILDNASKPLVIPFFMLVNVMYSRRKLLTNFSEKFNLEKKNKVLLNEPISNNNFLAIENDYGTVLYNQKFIDYRNIIHENVLYYYINPIDLSLSLIEKIIKEEDIDDLSGDGFLHCKTYYQLKEEK